jgi:hypothetical protein
VLEVSPVLASKPFEKFTFELLAAFAHLEDMHIITLEQLLFLAKVDRLSITFKFREPPGDVIQEGDSIKFTTKGFQHVLEDKIG